MAELAIDVTVDKYRYTMTSMGTVTIYRNGEVWKRDAQGDSMLMSFAARIEELEQEIKALYEVAAGDDI